MSSSILSMFYIRSSECIHIRAENLYSLFLTDICVVAQTWSLPWYDVGDFPFMTFSAFRGPIVFSSEFRELFFVVVLVFLLLLFFVLFCLFLSLTVLKRRMRRCRKLLLEETQLCSFFCGPVKYPILQLASATSSVGMAGPANSPSLPCGHVVVVGDSIQNELSPGHLPAHFLRLLFKWKGINETYQYLTNTLSFFRAGWECAWSWHT